MTSSDPNSDRDNPFGAGAHQLIVHSPGPRWQPGVPFRHQDGVEHHIATMSEWLAGGRLVVGGPFLDEAGGGAAVVAFDSLADAQRAAEADQAVRSGLLTADVRPYLLAMWADPADRDCSTREHPRRGG